MHQSRYSSANNPISIPVAFNYSQINPQGSLIDKNKIPNMNTTKINPSTYFTHHIPVNPPIKSTSQIVYGSNPLPQLASTVPFHHSQIHQPKIFTSRQETFQQHLNLPQNGPSVRPNVFVRNLPDYRRTVSPLNSPHVEFRQPVIINSSVKDKESLKYDVLRWQNKYEDLKTKYFELLTIVENNSHIEDSWLLEEENKLLREKVKLLEEKDNKYYNEVANRIEKMIDFHKETTTQQCSLLIDRYRLENKFLEKI